jgi:hypothetical protein
VQQQEGDQRAPGPPQLGVTYKTAWFMWRRIREAMKAGGVSLPPLGGKGKHVEVDETFIGRKAGAVMGRGGVALKRTVLSLVEGGGEVRSFHIDRSSRTCGSIWTLRAP